VRRSDLVFFSSGAAALVYQVAWARLLARLTGSDAAGVAVVLTVFMAGMGGGSWLLADLARRARDPRRTFAAIATALAAWAALSPVLLALLEPVRGVAARSGAAALVLLVPTALMGATFPLMGRLTIDEERLAGREVSGFYGANTIGAAAGALLAVFAILPAVGLSRGLWTGAALDLVAAGLALTLRPAPPLPPPAPAPLEPAPSASSPRSPRSPRSFGAPLAMTFAFGFSSLALEVLLTRLLVGVTGASVYAFGIVLLVFLLGLGLGARQSGAWLAGEAGTALRLARRCALFTPLAGLVGLLALRWQLGESDLFGPLANRMPEQAGNAVLWASHALFAGLAIFPPAVGFGMALPACVAVALERRGDRPRERVLGVLYAVNTAGAALGSLLAGFVLLPVVGSRAGVAVALSVALSAAVPAWLLERRSRERTAGDRREPALAAVLLVAAGALLLRPAAGTPGETVLFHRAGRDSTVTVTESVPPGSSSPVRALRVDGKVVATSAPVDLRLQRFLGILPCALGEPPETALVIGLGTGMTAGSLLAFPSLRELRVYEISSAVVGGAERFEEQNEGLLDDPRTEIEIVDGRHALALDERRYDVVTSDPIHPWTRGSSDLYALEHFRRMAAHLAPGGTASQWLPLYQLSTEDVHTVIATWCAAFSHVTAWLTAYDLVLVGAAEPRPATFAGPLPDRVRTLLAEAGVHGEDELAALFVAGDEELRALVAGVPPMREDHPRLEFHAPLAYLAGYSVDVLAWAAESTPPSWLTPPARERALELRALLTGFLERLSAGRSEAAAWYGDALLRLAPIE
jgi:spermidine synthase